MSTFDKYKNALLDAVDSIQARPLVSIAAIGMIGITMFLFSLILSVIINANHVTTNIENQMRISVFFKNDAEKVNEYAIRDILESNENVRSVTFVEKEDALEEMQAIFNDTNTDVSDGLGMIVNPLPDSLIVEAKDSSKMKPLVKEISEFGDVEKVSYSKELIENVLSLINITKALCSFFLVVVVIAMIAIITNVAKISIHSRQVEIEVMKYLGAYDSLIIRPLFMEGVLLGIGGGMVATVGFRIIYSVFITKVMAVAPFLELIPIFPFVTYMTAVIFLVSGALSGSSVAMATRKYLYKE